MQLIYSGAGLASNSMCEPAQLCTHKQSACPLEIHTNFLESKWRHTWRRIVLKYSRPPKSKICGGEGDNTHEEGRKCSLNSGHVAWQWCLGTETVRPMCDRSWTVKFQQYGYLSHTVTSSNILVWTVKISKEFTYRWKKLQAINGCQETRTVFSRSEQHEGLISPKRQP